MKLFAWDFHGVLEKGNDLTVQFICESLLEKKITLDQVRSLYGKTWGDYFRELKPTDDEKEVSELIEKAVLMSREHSKRFIKQNEYADEVLKKIKIKGDINAVISNTRPYRLDEFLKDVGLSEFFDEKIGIEAHFEKGNQSSADYKSERIKELKKKYGPEQTIVIGDSESDIEAGKKAGATTFMFDPWDRHNNTKADHTITNLREVLMVYK